MTINRSQQKNDNNNIRETIKQCITAQKIKFSIKNFCCKCDQISSFPQIRPHLLEKSLMENFIFCAVAPATSINDSSIFYLRSIVEYFETYNYLVLFAFMCYLSVEKHESIIFGDLIFGNAKILSYHFSGVFLIPFIRIHHSPSQAKFCKAI